MLKKEHRLPTYVFRKIYAKGKTKKGQFVILRNLNNYQDKSRFGIVISIKAIKKATARNLAKRRITEIINCHYDKIEKGQDLIFIVKKEASFSELEKEIFGLLNV